MAFSFILFFLILQIFCEDINNDFKINSNNTFQSRIEEYNKKLIFQKILNNTYSKVSNFKFSVFLKSSKERNLILIIIGCEIIVYFLCKYFKKLKEREAFIHFTNTIFLSYNLRDEEQI